MKRIISIICLLAISLFLCGCGEEDGFPKPTEGFYVNDFADVLDKNDEEEILSRAVTLNNKTTAQVVVIAVEDLDGLEPYDYALQIGREWGIGSEEKDNGIVILFAEEEREIYIAVGYGLEGALPDSKTGRIIDRYGLELLKQDKFSKGLLNITKAIINEVYIEYNIEPEEGYTAIDLLPDEVYGEESPGEVAISWIIMIVIVALFIFFSSRGGGGPFIWFGGPRGFGGGGFTGGSGRSGGFGGFSGGGGSFGGGGAGRGF